jgi:hypothetical protein
MKKEMAILANGNYEEIISPVQHLCKSEDHTWICVEYGWEKNRLRLQIDDGDPYEDGYSAEIDVKFCPFCGYNIESK